MEPVKKVPVTIITGFLGAGKTTLVNHILTANHGKKIAVIENEYGEIGIDDALVIDTKEEIFEMNNGCVCCTVRGDLIRILTKLLKRKARFDAILIETTGLADPAPVAQTFFVDDDLKAQLSLDAILTVVDARHAILHFDEEKPDGAVNESVQQVAFADRILLNKIDLVSEEEKENVEARIRGINSAAHIIECTQSAAPVDAILGLGAFDLEKILTSDPQFLDDDEDEDEDGEEEEEEEEEEHSHPHDHEHHHDDCTACNHNHTHTQGKTMHKHKHIHDPHVSSVGLKTEKPLDMQKLNHFLSKLIQEKGADIYRLKGILCVKGTDAKFVLQGVHMMVQMVSSEEGIGKPWGPGEERISKMVFIGKHLDREALTQGFLDCV